MLKGVPLALVRLWRKVRQLGLRCCILYGIMRPDPGTKRMPSGCIEAGVFQRRMLKVIEYVKFVKG